ncbi:MAG: NAD-dependent protein deacylase [Methanomethylovorans sp.]|uniref:SIR2 family NAD-dependent protein deacylase n=1 Tax=Methanomethylovorans sp. TaxID=2758717 RepID=UPI00345E94B9
MHQLLSLMHSSNHSVFLSGAGISTLSGIPDFRGSKGIYKQFDVDKIFDIHYFRKDPAYFYIHGREFIYNLEEREPNIIHKMLAKLEDEGIVKSIITQNIDMLHQKAGSKRVIEIHGSPANHVCLHCNKKFPYELISPIVHGPQVVPKCDGCGGLVKPDIIFFGEMLDQNILSQAISESLKADLMVVIGSSLVVQPAASLPLNTIKHGGRLVIINNMPTPLDEYAYLRYPDLEEVFKYLKKRLLNKDI